MPCSPTRSRSWTWTESSRPGRKNTWRTNARNAAGDALPAAAWLARQRLEARRTGDPRLEELIAKAEELIGPLPRRTGTDDSPMVCAKINVGDEVLELFALVVRFDAANDVTLSELRVELLYPANEAADRYFRHISKRRSSKPRSLTERRSDR